MVYKNVEFHNVCELEQVEGLSGWKIQRFPRHVRENLGSLEHPRGRCSSQTSTGCEIRFVTGGKVVRVSVSALTGDGEILVYKGNFFHSVHKLAPGTITTLHLEEPLRFAEVKQASLRGYSFSPDVWRICFSRYCAIYHGIDSFGYAIRPPKDDEVPRIRWLAYGSSITHGAGAITYNNSYIRHAADRLGVDVLCCGLGGACLCEKDVADFIAERNDWDFATLEIGVNMRNRFSVEEFKKRAGYLIKAICEKNPEKPVAVITVFPNFAGSFINEDDVNVLKEKEFNEILRRIVSEMNKNNLYLIEGSDVLSDFSGLTCDLLHPSDYGHILMGGNLAKRLENIIK